MTTFTATYSPDDNKLRLSASARLDADTYARIKAAGFAWAPKLEQFIAPMWTPERADLCIDLAGLIEDDDSTLQERMGGTVEALPADTFANSGTSVNTVLVVIDAPSEKVAPEPVEAVYMRTLDAVYLPGGEEAPRGWSGVAHDGENSAGGFVEIDGRNVKAAPPPAQSEASPPATHSEAPAAPVTPQPELVAEIVHNTLRKRYEWNDGQPDAQHFAHAADNLLHAVKQLDPQTAANYRAAAAIVRAEPAPSEMVRGGDGNAYPNRLYRCLAVFLEADPDPANAYMEQHPGACALKVEDGRVYLAHRDDKGTEGAALLADCAEVQS